MVVVARKFGVGFGAEKWMLGADSLTTFDFDPMKTQCQSAAPWPRVQSKRRPWCKIGGADIA